MWLGSGQVSGISFANIKKDDIRAGRDHGLVSQSLSTGADIVAS